MNNIHEQLNHRDFMRVHRSYVINTKKITSIEGRVVHLGAHTVQLNEDSYRLLTRRLKLLPSLWETETARRESKLANVGADHEIRVCPRWERATNTTPSFRPP